MRRTTFHTSADEVRDLLDGSLPAEERRRIVRHLLSGCEVCSAIAQAAAMHPECPDYEGITRRLELVMTLAENDVAVERRFAHQGWEALRPLPPERRLYMVKHGEEFHTWGMYERLIEEAKSCIRNDPLQAVDIAHLALAVTELLDAIAYGAERIKDFQAGAYISLSNAKRLVSDFQGAEYALRVAGKLLDEGTGDPAERAYLISIAASLKTDLGFLEDAAKSLNEAIRLARRVRDKHLEGRLIIQQSNCLGWLDPVYAIGLAERGLSLIDPRREPALHLTGRHLLALWTNESGHPLEASEILAAHTHLYKRFNDIFWQGRLLHLKANIARMENDFMHAEMYFRELLELYGDNHFEFDLALAALDLAEVLTVRAKFRESEEILTSLYPILYKWNIHVDILRAWLLLRENVHAGHATREGFKELAMTLRRKWYRKEEK